MQPTASPPLSLKYLKFSAQAGVILPVAGQDLDLNLHVPQPTQLQQVLKMPPPYGPSAEGPPQRHFLLYEGESERGSPGGEHAGRA